MQYLRTVHDLGISDLTDYVSDTGWTIKVGYEPEGMAARSSVVWYGRINSSQVLLRAGHRCRLT